MGQICTAEEVVFTWSDVLPKREKNSSIVFLDRVDPSESSIE